MAESCDRDEKINFSYLKALFGVQNNADLIRSNRTWIQIEGLQKYNNIWSIRIRLVFYFHADGWVLFSRFEGDF